jgi:ABC-type Fe3+/spermidine/putrescine transport system ATPase subunit
VQLGTPREIYEQPSDPFVADFIGQASFLPGQVVSAAGGRVRVRLRSGQDLQVDSSSPWEAGAQVLVAVRPERVAPAEGRSENVLTGTVRSHLYLGARHQYVFEIGDLELRIETADELPAGQVRVYVPPQAATLLRQTRT